MSTPVLLLQRLQSADPRQRRKAAKVLEKLGDPQAVEPLLPFLSDEAWWVRVGVAEALGHLGAARAIEPLHACLQDEDARIREYAERALKQLEQARQREP